MRRSAAILLLTLTAACANGPGAVEATSSPTQIADGRAIAEAQCARCHAVAPGAVSPHPNAPAFSKLAARYAPADFQTILTEDFIVGAHVGAGDMPTFRFDPKGADALVAYLKSIQD
jgi:mono/diheme cytochrome c family protein